MSIIWCTLYILGAITLIIVWLNLITFFIKGCTAILKNEWGKGGNRNDLQGLVRSTVEGVVTNRGILSRKDIESLIRMEVNSRLTAFETNIKEELKTKEDK